MIPTVKIICGDSLEQTRLLPDHSVNCCVTSPPYWGLRDYGVKGQLGLEKTPEEYVEKMVNLFREVRRVMRDDGTLWLNLGDSYCGGNTGNQSNVGQRYGNGKESIGHTFRRDGAFAKSIGCKPKDLIGIPWLVDFALRNDGWYLRSDIIWAKPNPMPESVTDRPTKAHEYVFLLSKSAGYYYDFEAIKEPSITGDPRKPFAPGQVDNRGNGHDRNGGKIRPSVKRGEFNGKTNALVGREAFRAFTMTRNKRDVWTVPTNPYSEAHFATFPPDLIKPCILAGCPVGGTVLDPFAGSGTTGQVAIELGRNAVLIELNPDYVKMIEGRTNVTPGLAL